MHADELPDARAHGAHIFTELAVSHIAKEADGWRVYFAPSEAPDAPLRSVEAKTVVLSAGTLGSTEILLRSREQGLPHDLIDAADAVGAEPRSGHATIGE